MPVFTVLSVGGFMASGVNLGVMSNSGFGFGGVIRAACFFIFGLIMLRGTMAGGNESSEGGDG